ncbi:hypothetical protein [Streptomyces sp. NPDC000410]|uniref:hypothetical protein n=1 Tax=Streptomyces sp. NPDC000410 TaxID=3154254 RepID=UPI0033304637
MTMFRIRCFAALGAAPLLALLPVSPAAAYHVVSTQEALPAGETCHLLGLPPRSEYQKGCRAGYFQGLKAGSKNGSPPICQKLPPPLKPVKPNEYERGLAVGYKVGYDESFPKAFKANCTKKPQDPPPPPPAQQQTPESMFKAGQEAGTNWGKEDAKTCKREHAELKPPPQPNVLIDSYQRGYRIGYDTAYDEAFRTSCPGGKPNQ